MPVAPILSLSKLSVSGFSLIERDNVGLPGERGKFSHLVYNLLQVMEFRANNMICRFIRRLSGREETLQLVEWIGPGQQRPHHPHRA